MCTHNNIATQSRTGTYETHVHTMYTQCHNTGTQSLLTGTYETHVHTMS
jgi:hypothetical protein